MQKNNFAIKDLRNPAASVRARLLELSRRSRQDFQRVIERYVIAKWNIIRLSEAHYGINTTFF